MRNLYNFISLKSRIIVYLVCNRIHIYYRLRGMIMEEVERFKTIEYNSYVAERYEVSTLGRVRNKQTDK